MSDTMLVTIGFGFFGIVTSILLGQWYSQRDKISALTASLEPFKNENAKLKEEKSNLERKYLEAKAYIDQHLSSAAIKKKYVYNETTGLSFSVDGHHKFCTSCLNQPVPVESPVSFANTGWVCTNKACGQFYPDPGQPTVSTVDDY